MFNQIKNIQLYYFIKIKGKSLIEFYLEKVFFFYTCSTIPEMETPFCSGSGKFRSRKRRDCCFRYGLVISRSKSKKK